MLPVGCLAFSHSSPYPSALGVTWESPVLQGHGAEVPLGFPCRSINPLAKVESLVWDQSQDVLMEKEQGLLYTQTHFCYLAYLLKIVSPVTQKAGYPGPLIQEPCLPSSACQPASLTLTPGATETFSICCVRARPKFSSQGRGRLWGYQG